MKTFSLLGIIMDNHTPEQRRKNMKAIKCKNTKIEVMLRKKLWARGVRYRKNVVILTCKTETTSFMSSFVENGKYRHKYPFTTCRKFKGLEADAIILIDVEKVVFEDENVLIFYVGASRARIKLAITAILTDDDCRNILQNTLNYAGKIRRPKRDLASALNSVGIIST